MKNNISGKGKLLMKLLVPILACVAFTVSSCSSDEPPSAADGATTTTGAGAATGAPDSEELKNPRAASSDFIRALEDSTWKSNIDSPMLEAQLICQRFDQGTTDKEIMELIEENIRSSSVRRNGPTKDFIESMTVPNVADYMLAGAVTNLCPEHLTSAKAIYKDRN